MVYFLALSVMVQTLGIAVAVVAAGGIFHERLLDRIVKAPMSFFDTTPIGRILNRFTQDMNVMDSNIRVTLVLCLRGISGLLTTAIAISYTTPIFIVLIVPLTILYYVIQVGNILLVLAVVLYIRLCHIRGHYY